MNFVAGLDFGLCGPSEQLLIHEHCRGTVLCPNPSFVPKNITYSVKFMAMQPNACTGISYTYELVGLDLSGAVRLLSLAPLSKDTEKDSEMF